MKRIILSLLLIVMVGVFSYADINSLFVPGYRRANTKQLEIFKKRATTYDYAYIVNKAKKGDKFVFYATIVLAWKNMGKGTEFDYLLTTNNWNSNAGVFSSGQIIVISPYRIKGLYVGENVMIYVMLWKKFKADANAATVPVFWIDYIKTESDSHPVLLNWGKDAD